jgi:hypothetical protein
MTAATVPVPSPVAICAPVTVDIAAMSLVVRRPENAGGYEKLIWREAHRALVKAEELGWPASMPFVRGSAPGHYQFATARPGPNLTLLFAFTVGTPDAKIYVELVGASGLYAFATADRETHYFMGVTFKHRGVAA